MKTSEQVMCNDEALELVKEMQATQGETSNEQKMADLLRFTCCINLVAQFSSRSITQHTSRTFLRNLDHKDQ